MSDERSRVGMRAAGGAAPGGAARVTGRRTTGALLAGALLVSGCAGGGAAVARSLRPVSYAAVADSASVLVWHLDETSGVRMLDAGRHAIDGRSGIDTRPALGRVRGAREFTRSVDSFVYAEYRPAFEIPSALTVEAWIRLDQIGQYEDTPIAMRWNARTAEKSWVFAVGGRNILPAVASLPSPGDHTELMPAGFQNRAQGKLLFAFQPADAGTPRAFYSNQPLELGRWTHVAATFNGRVVCFYVNGRLDAQYAVTGAIRSSQAALLVGNSFDTHALTTFGGELRLASEVDHNPYYAFEGAIDELRLSNIARTEFPYSN